MNTRLRERQSLADMPIQNPSKKEVGKGSKTDEERPGPKQLTLAEATPLKTSGDPNNMAKTGTNDVLAELRKFRQENSDSFRDLKSSFTRMETKLTEIATRTDDLEQRMTEAREQSKCHRRQSC